jgi:hypothetical protein
MADIASLYDQNKDLPEEQQKKIGQSPAGPMGDEHTNFVKTIARMIKGGEINVYQLETFYNPGVYDKLTQQQKDEIGPAMVNIADQLRHVAEYYISKQTPDASPQLEQMIEALWQMKDKVEQKYGDILKF